jgi:hypothetical protein
MITLQDIDVALARAEQLVRLDRTPEAHEEMLTCLSNARGMLRTLGYESTAALARMTDTLESLSDITQGR